MNAIYEAIDEFEFSNAVFPMTQEYANWETDAVRFLQLFFSNTVKFGLERPKLAFFPGDKD